jgi:outer membrane receptor protein involved in Fe transport
MRGDRLELLVRGTLQEMDGNNDLDSPPGGTPDLAVDVPEFDDTRLLSLGAELGWRLSPRWRLAVGGWHEDYDLRDSNAEGVPNYAPGSFFLAPVDDDYRATVLYVRASLIW